MSSQNPQPHLKDGTIYRPLKPATVSDTANSAAQGDLGTVPALYGGLCVRAGGVTEEGIGTIRRHRLPQQPCVGGSPV